LKNIGTIAGGDAERMRLLVKAFGDVTAAGKLQGQELRQFTNQGWNPLRKMVEMTGESYDDLRAKMEDGMISADMVSRAMAASAEEYGDRLEKAMDTMGAQWTKLKGLLTEKSVGAGAPIERLGAGLLYAVNEGLLFWTEDVPNAIDKAGTAIGDGVGRINEEIQRLNNIMDNPLDFMMGRLQDPYRFGGMLTRDQLKENLKEEGKAVLESQRMARDMFGKTTQQNQKLLDETRKQISEQKKVVQDLDDQFNRISKFTRMRLDAKLERKRKDLSEEDFQKQLKNIQALEDMHEEAEKKRRMIEAPGQDLEKMHAHRLKMIEEEGDARRKSIEDAYQLEMKQANLLRSMGGPSEDFTAAGADYKFIAQRQAEIEAIRFEKQATKKREDQLLTLHNDLEGLRTDAKLERETLKNVLGVVP
jgi:tape measure domain-containing protein